MNPVRLVMRCLIAGGIGATVYMMAAIALLEGARAVDADEPADAVKLLVNIAALLIGTGAAYLLMRRLAFRSLRGSQARAMSRFLALTVGCLLVGEFGTRALLATTPLGFALVFATVLSVTGAAFVWVSIRWVFAKL